MQEVLVDLLRLRSLDDLTLLPIAVDLHRKAAERSVGREGDREAAFEHARLKYTIDDRGLDAFRIFDLIYVLTPNNVQTKSMSVFARENLFEFDKFAYGSAASTLTDRPASRIRPASRRVSSDGSRS